LPEIGEAFMPLEQGKIIGYDADSRSLPVPACRSTSLGSVLHVAKDTGQAVN
jgi:hypothetical protein